MRLATAALRLAERGLHVLPLAPRDKTPARESGCLSATIDKEQITAWWRDNEYYNIGIATGERSGVFVLDVDNEAALRELEAQQCTLPASVESITARGRHVWLRHPDGHSIRNSVGQLAAGVDVRGDGGFVVAPPSIHPSGRCYAWSVDSASAFAMPPQWLLDSLAAIKNGNGSSPAEYRQLVRDGVGEGRRHDTLCRLTGHLLRRRIDQRVVHELLAAWNATKCRPPLPADEVARIIDDIADRELRRRTVVA
jgi:Bifunctional DNA primase/polymerase, N-terminal/Primase C terminal 1 (PriCT-1)